MPPGPARSSVAAAIERGGDAVGRGSLFVEFDEPKSRGVTDRSRGSSRPTCLVLALQCLGRERFDRLRSAEEVALRNVAAEVAYGAGLLLSLNAFRHDGDGELLAQGADRRDERFRGGVMRKAGHEALVDL